MSEQKQQTDGMQFFLDRERTQPFELAAGEQIENVKSVREGEAVLKVRQADGGAGIFDVFVKLHVPAVASEHLRAGIAFATCEGCGNEVVWAAVGDSATAWRLSLGSHVVECPMTAPTTAEKREAGEDGIRRETVIVTERNVAGQTVREVEVERIFDGGREMQTTVRAQGFETATSKAHDLRALFPSEARRYVRDCEKRGLLTREAAQV